MLKNDRKEKRRPHSLDVSELFNGMTDSTINTTTSQLWRPGPLSEGRDAEVSHKRELLSDVVPFIGMWSSLFLVALLNIFVFFQHSDIF